MTGLAFVGGTDISAIKNKEFLRIETDKAQEIVVALDKSGVPFSAGYGENEMELTFDGSFQAQVEEILAKVRSGNYDVLLRELQVYGEPDGYYRLLGEVAELLNTTVSFLQSRPDETHYEEQTNDQLDASMVLTGDKLGEMVQNGTMDMPSLAEGAVQAAQEVETLDRSQVASIADKLVDQPLASAEMQMEDDYNMIDGIINNGSKEDIDKARAELREGIKNMENLAENPFVPQEMRENATAELEKMRKQLELLDSADEIEVESWLMTMVDNGDAVLTDDGGFKVNPDYYKELPRNDRHVETMTEIQAVEVMSALTAAGVAYSAATKGEDKVGITVSKADVPALNDVMYASIGKIAHHAVLTVSPSMLREGKVEDTTKELTIAEWNEFISDVFSKYHIDDWNEEYINHDILDGTQWSVKVTLDNGSELEHYGSNDFPPNWRSFVKYINNLIAIQV